MDEPTIGRSRLEIEAFWNLNIQISGTLPPGYRNDDDFKFKNYGWILKINRPYHTGDCYNSISIQLRL